MPHQCVKCSRIIPAGSRELLTGCAECKGRFFFYVREEQLEKIKQDQELVIDIPEDKKEEIEQDIREIAGITDTEAPVILDLESIRAIGEGKFEIDVVNLFNRKRPLIYKMEEGKYIVDLAATLNQSMKDAAEIKNPDE